jgi:hypothetical protein
MSNRLVALAAALLAALIAPTPAAAGDWLWSFRGTSGDGKKVTQSRQVAEFKAVRLIGSLDVKVAVGPARSVAVTIDENLQPLVETLVEGDTLVIKSKSMSYRGEGRVEISLPSLRAFSIEGSGDVTIDGGQGDLDLSVEGSGDLAWRGTATRLAVSIEGSGDVKLAGTAEAVRLRVDGSGDIKAGGLAARDAEVDVSGSGDVEVTLTGGSLRAEVNGSGDVVWHGQARVEQSRVSGSGGIAHR